MLPYPNVAISVAPEELIAEAIRLKVELEAVGIEVPPLGPKEGGVSIQASFDPSNGIALILLSGVDDELLADRRRSAGVSSGDERRQRQAEGPFDA